MLRSIHEMMMFLKPVCCPFISPLSVRVFTLMRLRVLTLFMLSVLYTLPNIPSAWLILAFILIKAFIGLTLPHGALAPTPPGAGCAPRGHWLTLHRSYSSFVVVVVLVLINGLMYGCAAAAYGNRLLLPPESEPESESFSPRHVHDLHRGHVSPVFAATGQNKTVLICTRVQTVQLICKCVHMCNQKCDMCDKLLWPWVSLFKFLTVWVIHS